MFVLRKATYTAQTYTIELKTCHMLLL